MRDALNSDLIPLLAEEGPETGSSVPAARLLLRGISKRYPGVVANDGIDLSVRRGQIHAILGENGAGKSTLMKIIYGAVQADEGEIVFDGQPVRLRNPQQARSMGIAMVFQHFNLFESLSVAENIWLGQDQAMSREVLRLNIEETSSIFGLNIEQDRPVHTLSVGERQRVEILRSLLVRPKLLILDEPTSVLTPQAVQGLFLVLRKLAAQGCSILYISHKLHEIRQLCEVCTIMRQGKVVGVVDPRQCSNSVLSRMMIGADHETPTRNKPPARFKEKEVLRVRQLEQTKDSIFGVDLQNINLHVNAGEIVGIAGISGNGQQELLKILSGENTSAAHGSVELFGKAIGKLSPRQRRKYGLHFVPEERLGRGAVPQLGLAHNLLLTRKLEQGRLGWISRKRLRAKANEIIERFKVRAAGPTAEARSLSGGNLQKYIVGREIDAEPKLLIIAQPTWGVDVGAAALIHAEILALSEKGCAILVISEELDELFAITDRIYVIAKGKISPSLYRRDATVEKVGAWMSGLWGAAAKSEDPLKQS